MSASYWLNYFLFEKSLTGNIDRCLVEFYIIGLKQIIKLSFLIQYQYSTDNVYLLLLREADLPISDHDMIA